VHVVAVDNQEGLFVPPHWHETHDELFRVIKGRMEATIGSNTRIYVPEDGEILIPRRVVHSLRCFIGEEAIIEERTEPMVSELCLNIFVEPLKSFATNGRTRKRSSSSAISSPAASHRRTCLRQCKFFIMATRAHRFPDNFDGWKRW